MKFRVTIYLVGQAGAGKRSLVKALKGQYEAYSEGVSLWMDFQLATNVAKLPDDAFGVLLCYDVASLNSLEFARHNADLISAKQYRQPGIFPLRVLLGTKADLGPDPQLAEEVAQIRRQLGCEAMEVSSVDPAGLGKFKMLFNKISAQIAKKQPPPGRTIDYEQIKLSFGRHFPLTFVGSALSPLPVRSEKDDAQSLFFQDVDVAAKPVAIPQSPVEVLVRSSQQPDFSLIQHTQRSPESVPALREFQEYLQPSLFSFQSHSQSGQMQHMVRDPAKLESQVVRAKREISQLNPRYKPGEVLVLPTQRIDKSKMSFFVEPAPVQAKPWAQGLRKTRPGSESMLPIQVKSSSFTSRLSQEEAPVAILDVELDSGAVYQLPVYRASDAQQVAARFGQLHGLSPALINRLAATISAKQGDCSSSYAGSRAAGGPQKVPRLKLTLDQGGRLIEVFVFEHETTAEAARRIAAQHGLDEIAVLRVLKNADQ